MSSNINKLLVEETKKGYITNVEALLSKGANPNDSSYNGISAYDIALQGGHSPLIDVFSEYISLTDEDRVRLAQVEQKEIKEYSGKETSAKKSESHPKEFIDSKEGIDFKRVDMGNEFPVLTFISKIMLYFGLVATIGGFGYALFSGILEPMQPKHSFGTTDAIQLASGVFVGINGLITAALGESIGVLFAIEKNTRKG